ncbi:MAG: PQQ-binding-like beta-propeller repeat protein [Candidatus Bathyarchaeia archaeon]|jgi:hypothetical protein
MKNFSTSKTAAILISLFMIFAMGEAFTTVHGAITIPTIAFCNVAPSPDGIGQQVTVNFWLATPIPGGVFATNMMVVVTLPGGTTQSLGNFTSDYTGGTYTHYIPSAIGNYSFQMFYGGQKLTGFGENGYDPTFAGDSMGSSTSNVATLVVQQQPAGGIPTTPLPSSWWQTPVNSNNVQTWYSITGPWLGLAANAFGSTGAYNDSGSENPYTMGPVTGHILWTEPWCVGGVAGGDAGGNEQSGSYWTTSQYEPKWNPVVIDGIEYSTWYTTTTSYSNGIVATNLYNGQTMWTLNTDNSLVGGMQPIYETPNQYGVVGPYIITTGPLPGVNDKIDPFVGPEGEYNLYDALTGKYVCSIVNGTTPGAGFAGGFMTVDSYGNWVGYYTNYTYSPNGKPNSLYAVTEHLPSGDVRENLTGPTLCAWNMTMALGETEAAGGWGISAGSVFDFDDGLMWAAQTIPATLNGVSLISMSFFGLSGLNGGGLSEGQIASNVIVLTTGFGVTSVGDTAGWAVSAGFSQTNGQLLWIYNRTYTPYTRISENFVDLAGDGAYVECDENTFQTTGYSLFTGQQLWQITLTGPNGGPPNSYDDFGIQDVVDSTTGVIYLWGLGGDIWAININTGKMLWQTSTTLLQGSPGTETPYGIWPIWVQFGGIMAGGNNVLYLFEGHEYSPPLFHGAQVLALNGTTGQLIWKELDFADTGAEVSYNIMTAYNSYDGQIYAYGQGPSKTIVSVPDPITAVGSKVMIEGRVTDVSAGASQQAVASNFPNGLPCVSDASMSQFMEAVYEQQPTPHATGVPVVLSVLDSNNNYRTIGTTTTNGLGDYTFTWTPDIPGNYTVYATFAGTGAYYGSSASTGLYANAAAPTPVPTATPLSGIATQSTVEYIGIAIIIVIIIGIAVIALLVTRKHA